MKPRSKPQESCQLTAGRHPPYAAAVVTAANYTDLCIEFMRTSGVPNGEHFTIRNAEAAARDSKPETRGEWVAWWSYWLSIGYHSALAKRDGVAPVPARWPWLFSADANEIEVRLPKLMEDFERRFASTMEVLEANANRMKRCFADLVNELGRNNKMSKAAIVPKKPLNENDCFETAQKAMKVPIDYLQPPRLSPFLRSKLGLFPDADQADADSYMREALR